MAMLYIPSGLNTYFYIPIFLEEYFNFLCGLNFKFWGIFKWHNILYMNITQFAANPSSQAEPLVLKLWKYQIFCWKLKLFVYKRLNIIYLTYNFIFQSINQFLTYFYASNIIVLFLQQSFASISVPIRKFVFSWGFLAATNRWQSFTYPAVSMEFLGNISSQKIFLQLKNIEI